MYKMLVHKKLHMLLVELILVLAFSLPRIKRCYPYKATLIIPSGFKLCAPG